jgi:hypothetical protein
LVMDDIVDVDEFQHAEPLKRSRVEDDHDEDNEKQEGIPPPEGYQRVMHMRFFSATSSPDGGSDRQVTRVPEKPGLLRGLFCFFC